MGLTTLALLVLALPLAIGGGRWCYIRGRERGDWQGYCRGYVAGSEFGWHQAAAHYASELDEMNRDIVMRAVVGDPPVTYRLTFQGQVLTTFPNHQPGHQETT